MHLHELIAGIPEARLLRGGNPLITGFSTDSRTVQPGELFVALRGGQLADRHAFVPQAVAAGATGVIVEEPVAVDNAAVIQVPSTRQALGLLAARFYGFPGQRLRIVGVTGTNGKTTTSMLIHALMEAAGWRSGLLGTVEYRLGKRVIPSFMSTPEAHHMQRLLREMVDAGCQAAVMEATSHGLVLGRVAEVPFTVAVFTNITRDHLDFHHTPEAYLAAKALLFEPLDTTAHAVVNVDDPSTPSLLRQCRAQVVSYGRSEQAMIRLLDGHTDWRGTSMRLQTPAGVLDLNLALRGRFHQYNALAAVSAGFALGIAPKVMVAAMRDVHARGRFEAVDCGQDYGVIVDYAHTPDGLENVLQAAREFTRGRVICVFGCGGDRDRGKRPQMGQVAAQLADFTVVTSDNPRTEEPQAIIRDILPGIGTAAHLVEPDRRRAIALALSHATTGDVVVIAGKGHEDYQIIGREKVPFDDREVARSLLQELPIGRAG